MEIKVSVIIPVYNGEEHVRECLDSVIRQTLKEIEIICVNDGSSDESLSILKEYEEKDKRVIVIDQENRGAGAARNNGLRRAKGRYLSFLDSDDFFEEDMLEKAYEKAEEGNADIVVFGSDQYREDLKEYQKVNWVIREKDLAPYRPMNQRTFTDNVFKVFVGWAWDKLFLREFIEENHLEYQEIRTTNDMRFVFMAIVLAKRIETDTRKAYAHQRRGDPKSLSNTREKSWECFHEALISLREELEKRGLYKELEQDYINYTLHSSLWNVTTITGEKKEVLFNKLKNEWFEEFGISGKEESYFYSTNEFRQYRAIRRLPFWLWKTIKGFIKLLRRR